MEKASNSLRRSSVRLKSIGGGHPELNMIISELKNLRSHSKALRDSQQTATQDMLNWSVKDENRAIQETFTHLLELNMLWSDVQKEFIDHLNDFKYQFEMILEGEKSITQARNHLSSCEHAESKLRKELKKLSKKCSTEDIQALESKIAQAERSRDLAQFEVLGRIQENEAVKLIRVKAGLLKFSEAYLTLAHKCVFVYEGHRDIALNLPDVQDKDIHEIKYHGPQGAKDAMARARDRVAEYKSNVQQIPQIKIPKEPPPPYSPNPYYSNSPPYNPFYSDNNQPGTSAQRNENPQNVVRYDTVDSGNALPIPPTNTVTVEEEENLVGAMGGARI